MNIDELKQKLIKTKSLTFDDVDINDLEEISKINFSKKQDSNEKIIDFIKSSKNPYMFKCNGIKVKIGFIESSIKAEDTLTNVVNKVYK